MADANDYRAINACILFLPMIDGKILFTVESLSREALHPVQQAMVDLNGSQCGFCTPGFVMSLYAHYLNRADAGAATRRRCATRWRAILCRCTGCYGPIVDAARSAMHEFPRAEPDRARLAGGAGAQ